MITLDLIGPLRLFGLLGTLSEILDLFATLQDILGLFGLFWLLVILGLWLNWIILFLILGLFGPFWSFCLFVIWILPDFGPSLALWVFLPLWGFWVIFEYDLYGHKGPDGLIRTFLATLGHSLSLLTIFGLLNHMYCHFEPD